MPTSADLAHYQKENVDAAVARMNYPLLWDRQRQAKPAFQAVVDVLTRAR